MDRRTILKGIAGGTVAGAALTAAPLSAAVRCNMPINGQQFCEAGIPSFQIDRAEFADEDRRQVQRNWCWAACIASVFRYHGYDVPQAAFVQKVFGGLIDSPAQGVQIVQAINGPWRDRFGRGFEAIANTLVNNAIGYSDPTAVLAARNDLANNQPLIIGSQGNAPIGHATVLTNMTFVQYPNGGGQMVGLTVRDPWPFSPRRRDLSPDEIQGTMFLAQVRLRPLF